MAKRQYIPPEVEQLCLHPLEMLAVSGFNDDNNTEYFDEEYGGAL